MEYLQLSEFENPVVSNFQKENQSSSSEEQEESTEYFTESQVLGPLTQSPFSTIRIIELKLLNSGRCDQAVSELARVFKTEKAVIKKKHLINYLQQSYPSFDLSLLDRIQDPDFDFTKLEEFTM